MSRHAVIIGINYKGTPHELGGCIEDAESIRKLLIQRYGFDRSKISMVLEAKATKKTIIRTLRGKGMITQRDPVETLFVFYAGHGGVGAPSTDETDGKNETIYPYDFEEAGTIDDNELNSAIAMVPARTSVISVFDCCHSGTILDLPYRYKEGDHFVVENPVDRIAARTICLSGCQDDETSGETWNGKSSAGAMTTSLLLVLQENDYNITCWNLLRKLRAKLVEYGYGFQRPVLTTSEKLNGTTPFSQVARTGPFLSMSE